MAPRSELQGILETLLGSPNVYFQPPANAQLSYPCILYKRDNSDTSFADNNPYRVEKRYLVTVIDRNPDSVIPDKVAALPTSTHSRFYTVNNLNHDAYTLYY